jgi:dolichol-phosphate mannosyltransferase
VKNALVVIPTYNEKENITRIIPAVFEQSEDVHVLVIEDGSPDGTADLVRGMMPQFEGRLFIEERKGKLGLGTAYLHAFSWALARHYEFIFEMDADFSHDPKDLKRLYNACAKEGAGLAIGSRYATGVNVVNWPMGRVLMSYFASKYVRFITGLPVNDATAGFKCYARTVLERIPLDKIRFVGYAFQIEMKFKAWKYGFKIQEVPVIFTDRTHGKSKMSTGIFKEAFFGVISMKINSLFKNYK